MVAWLPGASWWYRLAVGSVIAVVTVSSAGCAQETAAVADETVNGGVIRVASFSSAQPGWDVTIPEFAGADSAAFAAAEASAREVKAEFASSGEVVKAILGGRQADIAHLADADDMAELVDAELVPADWDNGVTGGYPVTSVATMVVRGGNPRGIRDWPDLLQPGLEVITPNPASVGSGRWALLAAYASASQGNQDPEAGHDYLRRLILEHIALGPSTVQGATEDFVSGRGDVLLLSEASATNIVRKGLAVEQVLPPQTVQMDFPVAVTNAGLQKADASELVQFMFSSRGQQLWAQAGFRPSAPVPDVAFPTTERVWTIDELGGWNVVGPRYFGANGFITELFDMATQ